MDKTISRLLAATLMLFVGSLVAFQYGGANNPPPCCPHANAWTFLDYAGIGMLIVAVGLMLAIFRLWLENRDG